MKVKTPNKSVPQQLAEIDIEIQRTIFIYSFRL